MDKEVQSTQSYFLFFSHIPQIKWYGFIAKELKSRLGTDSILWVIGSRDRAFAEATRCFGRVTDLLEGISYSQANDEYVANLAYLVDFEKEHRDSPFCNEDVAIDRHIARRNWSTVRIAQYATYLIKRMRAQLDTMGCLPLAAFGEANTLPYRIAHRLLDKAVPYWNFSVVRHFENRFYLDHGQSEQWNTCRKLYEKYRKQGVPQELNRLTKNKLYDLRSRQVQPFYFQRSAQGGDNIRRKFQWRQVKGTIVDWITCIKSRESVVNPQVQTALEVNPINKIIQTMIAVVRKRYFDRNAYSQIPKKKRFASYFLHVQPEYSVEGHAFEFRDQLALIENIAAFLPADCQLIVKEHRPMVGLRDISFYKRIMRIPNVILLTDSVNSYEVIRRSECVFTLTGTAALEGMYVGVPSIVFGDIFFDNFNGMYKVNSIRNLKNLISKVLMKPISGASEDACIAALAAMYSASYPGKIGAAYSIEEMAHPENIRAIVDAVIDGLNCIGLRMANAKAGKK